MIHVKILKSIGNMLCHRKLVDFIKAITQWTLGYWQLKNNDKITFSEYFLLGEIITDHFPHKETHSCTKNPIWSTVPPPPKD